MTAVKTFSILAVTKKNRAFEIQKSSEKNSWGVIDFVPGFGTITDLHSYKYTVKDPVRAISYYRLIQQDFDGTQKIYDPIEVTFNEPFQFTLLQNYPNPFNPSTLIKYNIGKDSHVNLTIYNSLGQKVETLVNEFKPAGQYEIKFNASGYSSGIYIARIESGGLSKMIKMSLLK